MAQKAVPKHSVEPSPATRRAYDADADGCQVDTAADNAADSVTTASSACTLSEGTSEAANWASDPNHNCFIGKRCRAQPLTAAFLRIPRHMQATLLLQELY